MELVGLKISRVAIFPNEPNTIQKQSPKYREGLRQHNGHFSSLSLRKQGQRIIPNTGCSERFVRAQKVLQFLVEEWLPAPSRTAFLTGWCGGLAVARVRRIGCCSRRSHHEMFSECNHLASKQDSSRFSTTFANGLIVVCEFGSTAAIEELYLACNGVSIRCVLAVYVCC